MLSIDDIDRHLAGQTREFAVPESGTTVTLNSGAPRVMVPVRCNAKEPLRPLIVPVTCSIAT
jgi:hypothetical protein